jgi:hypothetical protein
LAASTSRASEDTTPSDSAEVTQLEHQKHQKLLNQAQQQLKLIQLHKEQQQQQNFSIHHILTD